MITINAKQQLYVIPCGDGYSTRGFKNVFREAEALASRLNRPELTPIKSEFGKLSVIKKHHRLARLALKKDLGTWFNPDTPLKVQKILETARKKSTQLRLFLGDRDSGKDWLEEFDVLGKIGRSMGALKVPLLINDDIGGPAVLDSSIVRIIRVADKKELYRHPGYSLGSITFIRSANKDYPFSVSVNGKIHARFKTEAQSWHWAAFIAGEVMEAIH